eukprot:TRINITY_DN15715_c0_g1_i1.p1 TRINITY_DN15715_c0_g1~~TRINITY_DN15715_c0_g1_i1.p1  ORF type:complete len:303 (+),score=83.64 TRINITY_DN15715_c0_g1_i1:55-909(+)
MDSPCAVFSDVLEDTGFAALREYVAAVAAKGLSPPPQPDSLTQGTLWCPLRPSCAPRNPVEAYIRSVVEGPLRDAAPGEYAGAEWWWQEQDAEDEPKEMHTDCDLQLVEGASVKRFPTVSSVLYLDGEGGALGPTAVFSKELTPPARRSQDPVTVHVAPPIHNSLLLFDGVLYHGVLHPATTPPAGWQRRTLLVNYWLERPGGPADLPQEFVAESGPVRLGAAVSRGTFAPLRMDCFALHSRQWSSQTLPPEAADQLRSAPKAVVCEYAHATADGDSGDGWDWE